LKDGTGKQEDTKEDTIEPEKPVCFINVKAKYFTLVYLQAAGKKGKKSKKEFADVDWYTYLQLQSCDV